MCDLPENKYVDNENVTVKFLKGDILEEKFRKQLSGKIKTMSGNTIVLMKWFLCMFPGRTIILKKLLKEVITKRVHLIVLDSYGFQTVKRSDFILRNELSFKKLFKTVGGEMTKLWGGLPDLESFP